MKAIKIIGLVFLLIIIIGAEIGYLIYHFQYDMNSLPKGTLITKVDSPNRKYTIKAYVTNGGATTDFAIRGELNFNGEKRKPKNVYWNYHEQKARIHWVNENTVVINGHRLTVPKEIYDYRRD